LYIIIPELLFIFNYDLLPATSFKPTEKEFYAFSLEEENFELKGRTIVKYSYRNVETPVSSWIDMFEHVVKYLHNEDKTILPSLTDSTTDLVNLSVYFSSDP